MTALLTSSRLRSARACQRKHRIEYVLGYRPAVDADALRFGTLVHLGLEAWWLAPNNRLDAALHAMEGEADPFERVKAEEMMRGYDARWGLASDDFDVIAVEAPFECDLINPATGRASQTWRLGGKVDAIVKDRRSGRVFVVEHKTASTDISPGSEYWRRLRMDGQVSVYFEGAASLGFSVTGCLYDVLGKPGLRPGKKTENPKFKKDGSPYAGQRLEDETPEDYRLRVREAIASEPNAYFQRGEVVRLEEEMRDALYDIWQLAQQIRESELAGRAPRNPDSCVQYGRTCPYFSVCTGEASLDDPSLFKKTKIHPELSGEKPSPKEGDEVAA